MLKDKWESAVSLDEFVEVAQENQEMWRSFRNRARVPAEVLERAGELPRPRYFLVLLEDWCGDAFNSVPYVAKLADEVDGFELRVLRRDEHPDLMDLHLSGSSRAIPVVIVMDEDFNELGWWGSRPAALQAWVESPESQAMEKEDRYREVRRWYAKDQGRSTLDEVVALLSDGVEDAQVATAVPA